MLYSRSKYYMFRPVVATIRSLSFDTFKIILFNCAVAAAQLNKIIFHKITGNYLIKCLSVSVERQSIVGLCAALVRNSRVLLMQNEWVKLKCILHSQISSFFSISFLSFRTTNYQLHAVVFESCLVAVNVH